MKSRFDTSFGGSLFSILVIFFSQITTKHRKKRNSAITCFLFGKKSIWHQFCRFTYFQIGDIFQSKKITTQNRKKRNSGITRVLLEKKKSISNQFCRFTFFDIGDIFYDFTPVLEVHFSIFVIFFNQIITQNRKKEIRV